MLEFFVSAFAPFLHKPFRDGSWMADDQAEKKREIGAENGPWAPKAEGGLGVQVSGAGGAVATASGSWTSPEGRKGLSVLCAGL